MPRTNILPQVNTHIGRMAEKSRHGKNHWPCHSIETQRMETVGLYMGQDMPLGTEFEKPTWLPGGGAQRRRV